MAELNNTSLISDGNLVAYYRMESGVLTTDSKNGFTLTNTGGVADGMGKFGGAADFGPTNSTKKLGIVNNLGIAGNGSIGISFWVKMNTEIGSGLQVLFQHGTITTSDRYFQIYYDYNAGTRRLALDAGGGAIFKTITLGTTDWHHIVCNRTTTTEARLYVDNVDCGTVAPGAGGIATNQFDLGAGGVANYSSVLIDDVGVFTRTLTAPEVNTLFTPSVPSAGGIIII